MWMPFGEVSDVGRGMAVLDGSPHLAREKEVLGFSPHWFKWRFWVYFKEETYSTRAYKANNISVRTIYQRNRYLFFCLKMYFVSRSKLAFTRNLLKR